MDIQWYPGHMVKMKRELSQKIKLVDVVIELLDARIPFSSKNPDIDEFAVGKKRLIILNKADMADAAHTLKWADYYKRKGFGVIIADSAKGEGVSQIYPTVTKLMADKIANKRKKGIINVTLRAMVVGIPNVGKSTLINKLYGKKNAKTENRPGVTRSQTWIRVRKDFELLDTPGILWPKFEDPAVGEKLAMSGAIKDTLFDFEELSLRLIDTVRRTAPNCLQNRFGIDLNDEMDAIAIRAQIAQIRGLLMREGELDLPRCSAMLIDEFRRCKLGRISLELPE